MYKKYIATLPYPPRENLGVMSGEYLPMLLYEVFGDSGVSTSLEAVQEALATLPERSAQFLIRRYGLDGRTPVIYANIALEYGLSGERVRNICAKALRDLRRPKSRKILRGEGTER